MTTETTWRREALKEMLSQGFYFIDFTKRDGTSRRLLCTKMMSFIPEEAHPKSDSNRKVNENALPVWSLADHGWRSFRLDSIKEVTLIENGVNVFDAILYLGGHPDTQHALLEHFINAAKEQDGLQEQVNEG